MLHRIVKYWTKNILRNKFLSLSSILVLTLLMFFINILFILHDVSFKLIDSINSKLTISLYLAENFNKNSIDVIDLIEDIKNISSNNNNLNIQDKNLNKENLGIEIEYKSKDQILEEIRFKEPDLAKILERVNPLPETIILSNIKLEEYSRLNLIIENKMYILSKDEINKDHFANYTTQYKKISNIIKVLDILQYGLYIIIAIFIVSIFVIIYSIIWNFIFYFKDEIYITRLVWWSRKFIYWPFVFQWGFYSLVSYLLSLIIFVFILKNINNAIWDLYFFNIGVNKLIIEMFIFVLVWWFSWYFSSRKYLKY